MPPPSIPSVVGRVTLRTISPISAKCVVSAVTNKSDTNNTPAKVRLAEHDKTVMAPAQQERRRLKKDVHLQHGRRWTDPHNDDLFGRWCNRENEDSIAFVLERSEKACRFQLHRILFSHVMAHPDVKAVVREYASRANRSEREVMDLLLIAHGGTTLARLPAFPALRASTLAPTLAPTADSDVTTTTSTSTTTTTKT